ncbi:unnamed protein product [Polarella glacialis]|uniref:Uncharacterized protein n=1 Tax=Polarella glacialis TaxID=89957 RepID=A0A813KPG8_POLGL|nr:unnamed protein product [Polarella glacialis]
MLSPSSRHVEVLGFPTVTPSGGWKLNVRNLRHQYWKLVYSQIQTPAAEVWPESAEACAWGSASSGSRIFRSASKLKMLLSQVSADPDNAYNWMVDLDLQMLNAGIRALTCASYPLLEADYLSMTTLTKHLTTKHQVEVAEFLEGSRHVYCIKGANWFEVARKGLVAPWCFRRDVVKTFSSVQQWWTSLDPRNFVVPEEGTFLALFRNGAAGMLPWDSDFDMKLYTEADITMEGFMNRTLDPPFRSMEIEAYAYDGCGQDNYVLLRRPNITHHIGDVYVRGGQARADHPWRANLFGVQVSLSPGHLEHIFFTRYRTPVQKLFGDGIPLQCVYVGHNACLPDCRNQDEPCEFEDNFVHVDHFASDT